MINRIENLDKKTIEKKSKLSREFALKNLRFKNTKSRYLRIFDKIHKLKLILIFFK